FFVVDQEDLRRLQDAYRFCGINPANPTKQHIREHCRTKIPQPTELLDRVEKVLKHFHLSMDPNNVPLFKPSMLKMWRIQRVHILRGCLSDPELSEGIMYRYGGTLQLNHVPGEGAKVPIWIPVRALMVELNSASKRVTEQKKYPVLHLTDRDTGERFGLEYAEPGCRPVPLDWDKHRTQKRDKPVALVPLPPVQTPATAQAQPPDAEPSFSQTPLSSTASPRPAPFIGHSLSLLKQEMPSFDIQEPPAAMDKNLTCLAPSNEVLTEERSIRAHKDGWTGFCVGPHTLDATHERSYRQLAAEVWVRVRTQQLWHSLTEGSETAFVPVVTIEPTIVNPPAPAPPLSAPSPPLSSPLTQGSIEKIVESILERQQHQPEQKRRQTKTCLACGQPKSRYETDGSSIHFFHQQGPSIVLRRCIKVMLLRDFLTPKCLLKNLRRQNSSKESWRPPRNGWRRRWRKRGKCQTPSKQAAFADSATWSLNRDQTAHTSIRASLEWQGNTITAHLKCTLYTKIRAWPRR
ncbi:hypothetical protein DPX16_6989, partial [Anabarilius grahami]